MSESRPDWDFGDASDFANEVVDGFSEHHPNVRMTLDEWSDLKEMIQRTLCGFDLPGDMPDKPASWRRK